MKAFAKRAMGAGAALMVVAGGAVAQDQSATMPETVGLAEAIQGAEQTVDGRVFEAEVEARDGALVYELELVDEAQGVHELVVDAATGEVITRNEQTIEGMWSRWIGSDELAAVTGAERSLGEIVAAIEAETGGTVREASIDDEDGRIVYEMELDAAGGGEMDLEVDPSTGEILKRDLDD